MALFGTTDPKKLFPPPNSGADVVVLGAGCDPNGAIPPKAALLLFMLPGGVLPKPAGLFDPNMFPGGPPKPDML
jgi:hypothetical protein